MIPITDKYMKTYFYWLGTGTLKSGGVNIVVWAKKYLKHIWYLIFTYICLCFTFCCLISPVEAILASSAEHDFIIFRSSWNFLSSMFRNSVGCQSEKCFTAPHLQENMRDNVEYNSSLRFSGNLSKNLTFRQHRSTL